MLVLNCQIRIGRYSFRTVHEVRIKKSLFTFIDAAQIVIPGSARMAMAGGVTTASLSVAAPFQIGDEVEIMLGYGSDLKTEFSGFVRNINYNVRCEIECDGYAYLLKRRRLENNLVNPSIKTLLGALLPPQISIHPNTPDSALVWTARKGRTAAELLSEIQEHSGLTIYFIEGNQLYAGLRYSALLDAVVKYNLGFNTIKDEQLKYRTKEDIKVHYVADYTDAKGRAKHLSWGDEDGQLVKYRFGVVKSERLIKEMVLAQPNSVHEGYEGKVLGFLQPYCAPGYKINLQDATYRQRTGDYIVTSTEVFFGTRGGRRLVELGPILSTPQQQPNEQD